MSTNQSALTHLITLRWRSGPNNGMVAARFCDKVGSVVADGATFMGVPGLSVRFTARTGRVQDSPTYFTLPRTTGLEVLGEMADGVPLAQLWVDIEAFDPVGPGDGAAGFAAGAQRYFRASGLLNDAWANDSSRLGVDRFQISGPLGLMGVRLGVSATSACSQVTFGDAGCKAAVASFTGQVRATPLLNVPGRVAVNFDGAVPDLDDLRWRNGRIEVDGGVAQIRESKGGPFVIPEVLPTPENPAGVPEFRADAVFDTHVLTLSRVWNGRACTLFEGCDRSEERCVQVDNLLNFRPIGKFMDPTHPEFGNRL